MRLVLVSPPPGVDFGIQKGSGAKYETLFVQQRTGTRADLAFDVAVTVKHDRADGTPNFSGPFVQGPPAARFIYIDVGTYAGQKGTPWSRRIKVPLRDVTWALLKKAGTGSGYVLEGRIAGTGKDGGPACATVALLDGWRVVKDRHSDLHRASSATARG